jgi:hypothetical protein
MRYLLLIAVLLFSISVAAQRPLLTSAEYFIDTDPGHGLATTISIVPDSVITNQTFSVATSALSDGIHRLYIRVRDTTGKWSITLQNSFVKLQPFVNTSRPNIVKAEYFIDTDPGHGLATDILIAPDSTITNQSVVVPISALSDGLHRLYLRTLDANGKWSIILQNSFVKLQPFVNTSRPNLVKAEYFIDTDPGHGYATDILITPDSMITNQSVVVPISSLSDGLHRLYLRTLDANGKWSITLQNSFVKLQPYVNAPRPNLVKAEYFIDTDPGHGLATNIPILADSIITNQTVLMPIGALPNGAHRLYIRTLDANGVWSITMNDSFNVMQPIAQIPLQDTVFCPLDTFTLNFTTTAAASGTIYNAELSDANGDFVNSYNQATGTIIGTTNGASSDSSILCTIPSTVSYSTNRSIRIYSSNGDTSYGALQSIATRNIPEFAYYTAGALTPCQNDVSTYAIAVLDSGNATTTNWIIPVGADLQNYPDAHSVELQWQAAGSYTLTVQRSNECGAADDYDIAVDVFEKPTFTLASSGPFCLPNGYNTFTATNTNYYSYNTYTWASDSFSVTNGDNILNTLGMPFTYTVTATDYYFGCTATQTIANTVGSKPEFSSSVVNNALGCEGDVLQVTAAAYDVDAGSTTVVPFIGNIGIPLSAEGINIAEVKINQDTIAYNLSSSNNSFPTGFGSITDSYSNYALDNSNTPTPYLQALELQRDSTYKFGFRVTATDGIGSNNLQRYVWIDFNQDGDFADANEELLSHLSLGGYDSIINGTFMIPSTAATGYYNMRFMAVQYDTTSSSLLNLTGPINNYEFGETEDYLIRVVNKTPLPAGNLSWQSSYGAPIVGDTLNTTVLATTNIYTLTASSAVGCTATTLVVIDTFAKPQFITPLDLGNGCANATSIALQGSAIAVDFGTQLEPNQLPPTTNYNYYYPDNYISLASFGGNSIPSFWQSYYNYNVAPGQGSIFGLYSNFSTFSALDTVNIGGNTTINFDIHDDISSSNPAAHTPSAAAVFVDFNRNGIFTDAGERIFADSVFGIFSRSKSVACSIPANASPGWTRVRIIVQNAFLGANISPRPGDYSLEFGEIEDYLIAIVDTTLVPNASFVWSPSADVTPSTGYQVTATNMSPTAIYAVQATSVHGCVGTKTFMLLNPNSIYATENYVYSSCEDSSQVSVSVYDGTLPLSYYWQFGTDTVATSENFYAKQNGTYTFTAVDACGVSFTLTKDVTTIRPQITLLKSNDLLCTPTDSVQLTVTSTDPFTWQHNGSSATQITVHPLATTTYTVTASTNYGCDAFKTIVIVPLERPQILSLNSTPIAACSADSFTLIANTSFTLQGPAIDPGVTQASYAQAQYSNDITLVTVNGKYNNTGGAQGPNTVFGSYSNYSNLNAFFNLEAGKTTQWAIQQSNAYYYDAGLYGVAVYVDYNRDGDFNDANEEVYKDSTPQNRPYYITLADSFNVPATASLGWTRMRFIAANDIAGTNLLPDAVYLHGETEDYIVNISGTGPMADASLTWSTSIDTANHFGDTLGIFLANSTTFTLTATADNGCVATEAIHISVGEPLVCTPLTSTSGLDLCAGDSTTLSTHFSGGAGPYLVNWTNNGNTISTDTAIRVGASGIYIATVSDACGNICTNSISKVVHDLPVVQASVGQILCNASDSALVTFTGATLYSIPQINTSVANQILLSPNTTTSYIVLGEDSFGCVGTDTFDVQVGNTPTFDSSTNLYNINSGDSVLLSVAASVITAGPQEDPGTNQSSFAYNQGDEEIYSVEINGVTTPLAYSGTAGCTNPAPGSNSLISRYSDFTPLGAITTVNAGDTYTWTVHEDECDGAGYYSFGTAVFIDFNRDGDFNDTDETIFLESNTTQGPRSIAGTFSVPANATPGWTRIRFIVAENNSGTQLQSDLKYGYGETEDWLINVQGISTLEDSLITWLPANKIFSAMGDSAIATALTSSQIYTVTATGSLGCTAASTIEVIVQQTFDIDAIASNVLCNGDSSGGIGVTSTGAALPVVYTIVPNIGTQNTAGQFSNLPAGAYTVTATDQTNATRSEVLNISQPNAIVASSVANACDSLIWQGTTYTASTQALHTFTTSAGCDSTHTLDIVISYSSATSAAVTACDSFSWLGSTYTNSIAVATSYSNTAGCDSVHTMHITINHSTRDTATVNACNTYVWNGITYTTSTTVVDTYANALGCDSFHFTNIVIHYNSAPSTQSVTASFSYQIPLDSLVTTSGSYAHTYSNANGCDSMVTFNVIITGVRIQPRVLLSGPFVTGTGLMHDSLRLKNLIPLVEPYGNMNSTDNPYTSVFTHVNGGGGESTTSQVLLVAGNNAIVDWVFVQLRSSAAPNSVVATRSALVQRDGDVVDVDGGSPVEFPNLPPGDYKISVLHRNHLGAMASNVYSLSGVSSTINFANTATVMHINSTNVNAATRLQGTVQTLFAGNCLANTASRRKILTYNSTTSSDRAGLLAATPGTSTRTGYTIWDCDMNGFARFNGLLPDRLVILSNLGNSTSLILFEQVP